MDVTLVFEEFCKNLKVMNTEDISTKYRGITKKLNKKYYDNDSETSHCLQVGSYGRKTGINGISDLDMLFGRIQFIIKMQRYFLTQIIILKLDRYFYQQ